jgi:hypothetical protein
MTLPSGNPVVSDTEIDTSWANPTMADLAAEIQDSLSRSGKGGMLVPFQNLDGTSVNPGITFTNQTGTGFYRTALGVGVTFVGAVKAFFAAALARFYTDVQIDGDLGLSTGKVESGVADGASAVAHTLDVTAALTTVGAKLLSIKNAGVEKFALDKDGKIVVGAAPNYALSALSTGSFNTTNLAWTDVTNAVVTGFVATGRPIEIYVVDDGNGVNDFQLGASNSAATLAGVEFQVLQGATVVGFTQLPCPKNDGAADGSASFPPGTMFALTVPVAGTYTFKLQVKSVVATSRSFVRYAKLYVKEI